MSQRKPKMSLSDLARVWLAEQLKTRPEYKFCAVAETARPEFAGAFGLVISPGMIDGVRYYIFENERARDAFVKAWKGRACPIP